jgi:hypothetical protein
MGQISSAIPNLIQGVSQQSSALRLSSQAEIQENAFPSLVEGLHKRPPLQYIAKMKDADTVSSFVHLINRDITERYFVTIDANEELKVFGLDGTEYTVNFPDGTSYLSCSDATTAFRAVTVADFTYILNTEVEAQMASDLTPTQDPTGLVAVKQGDYNQRYTIYLNGSIAANITTSEDDQVQTRTDDIASRLASAINGSGGFTATNNGSTVVISRSDNQDFTLATYDSLGDTGLTSTLGVSQRFDDLPRQAPDGYVVRVQGDQTNDFDDYFVKFVATAGSGNGASEGTWVETVKPNIQFRLNGATMPHLLRRNSDGTFTFLEATWGERTAGDENSVGDPTFVGEQITDIFFFQNRLGLLAGENVIMSRTSEYYDFFSTTARNLLDTDPIDIAASHTKVSILKHAIPFDRKLLLFSDQTQFILKGADYLSPTNTSITQTTEFEASTLARPAAAGNVVYFPATRGGHTSVREYYVIDDTDRSDATDVTAHVSKYVPDNVYDMTASTTENSLVCLTREDPSTLFLYKWHWAGREKMQSAWFKYTFNGLEVLNAEFIESGLYIVGNKEGKTGIFLIRFDEGREDPDQDYVTRLDYRYYDLEVTTSYDSVADQTTITTPIGLDDAFVVTRGTNQGSIIDVVSSNGVTTVVEGDVTNTPFYIGERYRMTYEFSEPTLKESTASGGRVSITGGRLQIKHWMLRYQDSGEFNCVVGSRLTNIITNDQTYKFTGRVVGGGQNIIGGTTLTSGDFRFPVLGKSDRVRIIIQSDSHLPCQFLSAEWEGNIHLRSRRMNG